jgi:hypothetical protein
MEYKYIGNEPFRVTIDDKELLLQNGDIVSSEKELIGNFELIEEKKKKIKQEVKEDD